ELAGALALAAARRLVVLLVVVVLLLDLVVFLFVGAVVGEGARARGDAVASVAVALDNVGVGGQLVAAGRVALDELLAVDLRERDAAGELEPVAEVVGPDRHLEHLGVRLAAFGFALLVEQEPPRDGVRRGELEGEERVTPPGPAVGARLAMVPGPFRLPRRGEPDFFGQRLRAGVATRLTSTVAVAGARSRHGLPLPLVAVSSSSSSCRRVDRPRALRSRSTGAPCRARGPCTPRARRARRAARGSGPRTLSADLSSLEPSLEPVGERSSARDEGDRAREGGDATHGAAERCARRRHAHGKAGAGLVGIDAALCDQRIGVEWAVWAGDDRSDGRVFVGVVRVDLLAVEGPAAADGVLRLAVVDVELVMGGRVGRAWCVLVV